MLETSKDLLNILIGVSIAWVALALSYLIYQMARTFKSVNDTIEIVKNIAKNIDEGVKKFKDRAGEMAAYMTFVAEGAKKIFNTIQKKKAASKTKKQK